MCDPVSLAVTAMAASTVMGTVSAVQSTEANNAKLKYQERQARANAALAEEDADRILDEGEREVHRINRATDQRVASARAGFAGSGVLADVGSAGQTQSDIAMFGEMDALTADYNSQVEARNARIQAGNFRDQGKLYRRSKQSSWVAGVSAFVAGAAQTAATGASLTKGK
jgi:hypothetical protein